MRSGRNNTPQRKCVGLDTIINIESQCRKRRITRGANIQGGLPQGFLGNTQVRILPFPHGLNLIERGQCARRIEVVHNGEVFIEPRKYQNSEIQSRIFHSQRGFLKILLLLLVLDLRFDDVTARDLTQALLLPGDIQESLSLLKGLLRRRVLPLRRDEAVVIFRDRDHEPALRDFHLRIREGFGGLRAAITCIEERVGSNVLVDNCPGSIDVDAIIRDKPAARSDSVALCAQILRGVADAREKRRFRLKLVLTGHCRVRYCRLNMHIEIFRPVQRVLQRDDRRRSRLSRRLNELQRGTSFGVLRESAKNSQNADYECTRPTSHAYLLLL